MLADLLQGAEVDLQQHRDDHHPDQHADRKIDLGDLGAPMAWKSPGNDWPKDAGNDAESTHSVR